MFKKQFAKTSFLLGSALLFCFLLLPLLFFSPVVSADTPPRPELTATPTPVTTPEPETTLPSTAVIILTLPDPAPVLWTSVQWQDEQGVWINASGWQSDFNADNMVVWAVAPAEYGTGPYRWVIYAEEGGDIQAMSDLFELPNGRYAMRIPVDN